MFVVVLFTKRLEDLCDDLCSSASFLMTSTTPFSSVAISNLLTRAFRRVSLALGRTSTLRLAFLSA